MMIYGLHTCAICQKARRALEAEGTDVGFRDVRAEPLSEAELSELIAEFGDRLVDRKSNDCRALNDWLKNSELSLPLSSTLAGFRSPGLLSPQPRSRLLRRCDKVV